MTEGAYVSQTGPAGPASETPTLPVPVPADAPDRIALLVVGMHRSGTSMAAGVLNLVGCDTADTLLEADQFNQRGYWESPEIAALNDEILASAGLTWDDWGRLSPEWYASPRRPAFEARALDLLERLFAGKPLFLLKDPRFCLLLPFWLEVLAKFGAVPRVVLPWRHPLEVAASLLRRNGMNPSIAQVLWLRHVLEAEHASRDLPRSFLRYGELTRDWRSAVQRAGAETGVSWPRISTATQIEVDAFLSTDLRHHDARSKGSLNGAVLIDATWLKETVSILESGAATAEQRRRLDEIRREFDSATELFGRPVAEITQHGRRLKATLTEVEAELAGREADLVGRKEELAALQAEIGSVQDRLKENRRALSTLQGLFAEAGRSIEASNDERAALKASLAELQGKLTAAQGDLAATRDAFHAITNSRIWRSTAPYRRTQNWIRRKMSFLPRRGRDHS